MIIEHGTAMAGIIVGNPLSGKGILGIAPKAKLISIDFSSANTDEVAKLISSIEYAINKNVDIINISMGINKDYEELHKVVKQAYDKGIIIIAAAGNGQYDEALYPAKYDEVIGVGAINKDGDLLFKNLGLEDIIVLSPGKNIITTYSSKDSEEKYKGIKAYVE